MINFYSELGLTKEQSLEEIQDELGKLENIWRRRETVNPEKATKMISLIFDAKEAFKSHESRRKYDRELDESSRQTKETDPEKSRLEVFHKNLDQARKFYDDEQYDLAKTAIEKAIKNADYNAEENEEFLHLAAKIYMKNDDIQKAMDFVNKAIVVSPDWSVYYMTKGQIYERAAQVENDHAKRSVDIEECRKSIRMAVTKARSMGDKLLEGDALGMLAFSLYFHMEPDPAAAEEYAQQAVALGETANAKRVLDDIDRRRTEERRQREAEELAEKQRKEAEERARCQPIYDKAIEYEANQRGRDPVYAMKLALGEFEKIPTYADAAERISDLKKRIEEETAAQKE